MTSTCSPSIDSLISVTSSGRSSINRIIRCISGLFLVTAVAICFNRVVLPDFGCDTIMPRCPFPIGEMRSTTLIATLAPGLSRRSLSFGNIGTRSSKLVRFSATSGVYPLTVVRYKRAWNFSRSDFTFILPFMISPVFKLKRRICAGAT